VIRLFNVYYPIRKLILLIGEALIVWSSLQLGAFLAHPDDYYIVLNFEGGHFKILVATALVLLCSHWFDLYDTAIVNTKGELYFRLLLVPAMLAFALAGLKSEGITIIDPGCVAKTYPGFWEDLAALR